MSDAQGGGNSSPVLNGQRPVAGCRSPVAGPERWRRLPWSKGSATELLAGAEAMLAGLAVTGQPSIRWSVVDRPALLLGSSQRPHEADFPACEAAGVTVHRRRSGGTAVFADEGLLWLDVALPGGHRLLPADITEAYRWFGEVWAAALDEAGIRSRAMPQAEARQLNNMLDPMVQRACFGGVSPYEVFVDDRKIVGLAQVRRRPGELLQSGIYRRWEPDRLVHLLNASPEERDELLRLLAPRARGLDELEEPRVTFEDVIRAWERALTAIEGVELADDTWMAEELAAATAARERYEPLTTSPHKYSDSPYRT